MQEAKDKAKAATTKKVDRTQCVFEIKPWSAEQDLEELAAKIKATEFKGKSGSRVCLVWGGLSSLVLRV